MARNHGHAPADVAANETKKRVTQNIKPAIETVVSVNYSGWQNDLYSLNTHTKLEIVFTRATPAFDNLSVSNV